MARGGQRLRRLWCGAAILGAGLALGACSTGLSAVAVPDLPGQVEVIQGAAFTRDMALFSVSSKGCRDREDVKPFITKLRSRTIITLRSLEEDGCVPTEAAGRAEGGVLLKWSFEELGLEPGANIEVNSPYQLR